MTIPWRRLPPVHSPIGARAITRALVTTIAGPDPRARLVDRLRAEYHAPTVCLTDSGTSALELAIGVARVDEVPMAPVAIPAYSCYDLATAAVGAEVPLVLYDLDPRTLGPDLASLERCLAEGARTVVVAPLYGMPIDWAELARVTKPWGARIIEDAAQGFGAEWGGRPLGTLAEVSVLSFGRGKGWTGGAGGALLMRGGHGSAASAAPHGPRPLASELAGLAAIVGQWLLGRPAVYALPAALPWLHLGETRYRASEGVRPMRRSSAALVAATWDDARREAGGRRAVGARLRGALGSGEGVDVVAPPRGGTAGELRLPILLRQGAAELIASPRARQLGVGAAYPAPLAALPAVRARLAPWCRARRWRGAEELVQRLVTGPTHSLATESDRFAFVQLVRDHSTGRRSSARS